MAGIVRLLGARPLQSVTKSDVEDLVDWMLTAGRRRGGKPGTGLSGRSARLTLGRFSAALEAAVLEGKLVRNVARLVKPPEHTPRERETWSKTEVRKFLAKASSDRLHVAWRLSLYGLRRGEVLGLRWSDIDLRAGTLTVNQARVLVEYRVRIEEPKSRNGKRTLPLDSELVAGLTALRKRQLEESTLRVRPISQGSLSWSGTRGRVRDNRRGWHFSSSRVVFRRVRPPAEAGRAAADHPARLASHDPDAHGACWRTDLDHQQVGRSL